jgi:23S rRNA (guanine745-N1)-methyltransferase
VAAERPGPSWTAPTGAPSWRCPTCQQPLAEDATGAWCATGHRVDRAREGYLNLLPGGRLRGRPPGDSVEMLRARRALFDAGHYAPVQRAVAAMVASFSPSVVLDAGCGEGAYLAVVDAPQRLGIDVAKEGIRMAARRYPDARWAVASSYQLPVDDGTVDVVSSVFAPRPFDELHRVLRPDGVVVVASPGPDHLAGLTDLIYGAARVHEQRPHTGTVDDGDPDEPVPSSSIERERVRFTLDLDRSGDITNLLHMTPYWWRASEAQRAAIGQRDRLTTAVDIVVTAHRR